MNRFCLLLTTLMLSALLGCGQAEQPILKTLPAPTPLTIEDWKKLPIEEKYDELSFDRLKLQDPKLKSDAAWRAFMKKEILPERTKDFPPQKP
ncbi:MAG TPA: hypothetical protein VL096_15570 [Pirellulaceae bacterium]|nr:hypothetical protein [Pirellulaceae bacterium]